MPSRLLGFSEPSDERTALFQGCHVHLEWWLGVKMVLWLLSVHLSSEFGGAMLQRGWPRV